MITTWIAIVCLLGLVFFQLLLTFGFPLGEYSMGGKFRVYPPLMRFVSFLAAIILALAACLLLNISGIIDWGIQPSFLQYAGYGFGGYLCLNIMMNLFSRSKKEKYTMTPLSAIVAFCFLYTTYNSPI